MVVFPPQERVISAIRAVVPEFASYWRMTSELFPVPEAGVNRTQAASDARDQAPAAVTETNWLPFPLKTSVFASVRMGSGVTGCSL